MTFGVILIFVRLEESTYELLLLFYDDWMFLVDDDPRLGWTRLLLFLSVVAYYLVTIMMSNCSSGSDFL